MWRGGQVEEDGQLRKRRWLAGETSRMQRHGNTEEAGPSRDTVQRAHLLWGGEGDSVETSD